MKPTPFERAQHRFDPAFVHEPDQGMKQHKDDAKDRKSEQRAARSVSRKRTVAIARIKEGHRQEEHHFCSDQDNHDLVQPARPSSWCEEIIKVFRMLGSLQYGLVFGGMRSLRLVS